MSDYGGDSSVRDYIRGLLSENLSIPHDVYTRVFNVSQETLAELQKEVRQKTITQGVPLTWDYVMAFKTGDETKMHKPTSKEIRTHEQDPNKNTSYENEWKEGMTERKYFSQIILQTQKELEDAKLSTKLFKSKDGQHVFLILGITEENLNIWANDRDTDLEIDPIPACREGRRRDFALALRTQIDEQDDPAKCTLPLINWENMYCQYNPKAEKSIYRHYPRFRDKPDGPMTCFDERTRLRIIYETIIEDKGEGGAEIEIQSHIQSQTHPMVACFPLHNEVQLEEFSKKWVKNWTIRDLTTVPLQEIRDYFGEPIAFYYGFMMFYLRWLVTPAIIGILFFIGQLAVGQVDIPGLFLLSLFIIFWCVAFVDFWLRQESRHRLLWGMTKFEKKAVARPEFKGEWVHDRVSGLWIEDYSFIKRFLKGTFVFSGLGVWMAGCVVAVVYVLLFRDANPTNIGLKVLLGVINGVMIAVFDFVYQHGSQYGNEWENHRTEQDFQDALISKSFIFKFFNSFSSLFYLSFLRPFIKGNAYYLKYYPNICGECKDVNGDPICLLKTSYTEEDYECCYKAEDPICSQEDVETQINVLVLKDLQLQLATLFITAIVIQNTVEILIPSLTSRIALYKEKKAAEERGEPIPPKSAAEEQMILAPVKGTIDDMSEMVIQFGYVTMFVIALPITPLLAFINNVLELKVDGYKLVHESQRPHPNGSHGLGAWNGVLSFFSIVAVGTNVALITWRTEVVLVLISSDPTMKWVFFSIVCIGLSLLVGAEKWAIPDVPLEVLQGIERQRLIENVLVLGAHIDVDEDQPPRKDEEVPEFAFDPTKDFIDPNTLPLVPLGDLRTLQDKEMIVLSP